ncbi:MAG: TonB-dependent receptor [Bacteroidales bacterium]|nr:TonB-dependent receptor [Bacteroidales bacterium]
MQTCSKLLLAFLISLSAFNSFSQDNGISSTEEHRIKSDKVSKCGSIAGVINDNKYKEPITGATIQILNTNIGVVSDLDGVFELPNLAPRKYKLLIKYISYKDVLLDLDVKEDKKSVVNIEMVEESRSLQSLVVIALMKQNTDVALLSTVKNASVVQTGISAQQIKKTQDSDASGVMKRLPGISLIDNKFVMVRGLSQRYNNVWINNSAVPSSEADSRAFSFDIIPSSQLDNMMIVKSQSPELPADFSGGFIQIQTKEVPDKNDFSITVGTAFNDQTHFNNSFKSNGSSTDFLGYDNGYRNKSLSYKERLDNDNSSQVTSLTQNGFNNDWKIKKFTPIGDLKISSSLNRKKEWEGGAKASTLLSLNYTNSSKTYSDMKNARYGIYNINNDEPEYLYSYNDNRYDQNVRLGGMANFTFIPHKGDVYEFKNIVNQLATNRYTERSGFQNLSGFYQQEKNEYYYMSRTTYSGQLTGTHTREKSKLDYSLGYSYSNKNQPDRRIINREENGFVGDDNYGKLYIDQNEIEREFSFLKENIVSGNLNYKHDIKTSFISGKLKTGAYTEYRNRNYDTRSFNYRWNSKNLPLGFNYGDVINDILIGDNYSSDKLYIYEDTDNRNSYSGSNLLASGYAELAIPINKFDVSLGARYEYNIKNLISYTTINDYKTKEKDYIDSKLFPSANVAYRINDQHQLRGAYGQSVNRPEFREVSNSVYYDFDLFSDVKGNPNLKTAFIQNVNLAYEYYPSNSEIISLSLFYKNFKNPIEWTYIDAGGSYTYTFENANRAKNYGLELEIRKRLDFIGLNNFSLNFNGALINSKVEFDKNSLEKKRPMQGQSPYLINAGLFYRHERYAIDCGILYNRIGKRIIGVGRVDTSDGGSINNNIPDSYEMPRNSLDFTFRKKINNRFEISASINDILSEALVYKQFPEFIDAQGNLNKRSQTTKSYKPGRSLNINFSMNF